MQSKELIQELKTAASCSPTGLEERERKELIEACNGLRLALETPFETAGRIVFGAHEPIALRLGVDLGLFDTAAEKGGDAIRADELAAREGADILLVVRVMRMLIGLNLFQEIGQQTYRILPLGLHFTSKSPFSAGVIHMTDQVEVLARLPTYFAETGFKNPDSAQKGPFQFTWNTDMQYFDWLKNRPRQQAAFNTVMSISRKDRGEEWFDFYPVEERLQICEPSQPLLVDIGGGLGHDLVAFKNRFPNLPGRLIVQDMPSVVGAIDHLPEGIDAIGHDFFTPQSIKGAKAYYLRAVLHDWPDAQALKILGCIKSAMDSDSVLLINENVLPEEHVSLYAAKLDMSMMALFASLDRTRPHFQALLEKAGFQLVNVWTPRDAVPGSATLFEAVSKTERL